MGLNRNYTKTIKVSEKEPDIKHVQQDVVGGDHPVHPLNLG